MARTTDPSNSLAGGRPKALRRLRFQAVAHFTLVSRRRLLVVTIVHRQESSLAGSLPTWGNRGNRMPPPTHGSQRPWGGQISDAVSINERSSSAKDCAVRGHWESDLTSGSKKTYIATLAERHGRYVMLVKAGQANRNGHQCADQTHQDITDRTLHVADLGPGSRGLGPHFRLTCKSM